MRWLLVLVLSARVAEASTAACEARSLTDDIAFLASPDLDGRATGTDGDAKARAYILARMKCIGLATSEQPFKVGKLETANVIGTIAGETDDIIIVAAHHDHLGDKHLGANDNASGVAAMLAVAQAIASKDSKSHRTIAFVAFGGEEMGELGSTYFAAHAPDDLPIAKVVEVINLDMVGSYKSKGVVAAMGTFPKFPARKLLDKLVKKYPKTRVALGGHGYRSDHEPFCEAGIPYTFFWTPDGRCYHEKCDKPGAIDTPHMTDIASLAGDLTWELAATTTDLAASRTKLGCGQSSK